MCYISKKNNMNIETTVAHIENGTLPWEEWNHYNHLLLALYYIFTEEDEFVALTKTRCALTRYGTLANKEYVCPLRYHETMTVFWCFEIKKFISKHQGKTLDQIEELLSKSELLEKGYINKFYSTEVLISSKAKAIYIAPQVI